ncbi:PH domain-containing protein [Nonomuraea sp. NPDC050663]|uniref:PH domain-containing protein n=1 Tax=Nonomuraea sp. NPDC050663 TaxID=3364370 RepID=UPI00379A8A8F
MITVLFMVIWLTGTGWFTLTAIVAADVMGILIGAAFVVTGLTIAGRPLLAGLARASYTVTDQRVIVQSGGRVGSAYLHQLPPPVPSGVRGDGSGSVVFGAARDDGAGIELHDVPDAHGLCHLIARAQSRGPAGE